MSTAQAANAVAAMVNAATASTSSHKQVKRDTPPDISLAALDMLDPESFDWADYCGTYKGRALITRLTFVSNAVFAARHHHGKTLTPRTLALARGAALQAIPLLKDTLDTDLYVRTVGEIHETLNPDSTSAAPTAVAAAAAADVVVGSGDEAMDVDPIGPRRGGTAEKDGRADLAWVDKTRSTEQAEETRLGVELNGYISNLIKESIRLTYLAMAQLDLKAGHLPKALSAFHHAREYSSGPAHHVDLGLAVIEAGLSFNDTATLPGYISKVEAMLDRLHPPTSSTAGPTTSTMTAGQVQANRDMAVRNQAARRTVSVKLRVARAIGALASGDYRRAARELGEVPEEGGLQEWEGVAISTSDVAFICAICTLATGSREHIRRVLLDRPSFHAAVGDTQRWILDLVRAFVDARYGDALALLAAAEPHMLLNPFLAPHTTRLLSLVRTRGIVQYLTPFSSVRVSAMAAAFGGADEEALLAELCSLAEDRTIPVHVDLVDRVLTIVESDPRAEAFTSAITGGRKITTSVRANLFRMRLKEAGVVVDPARHAQDQQQQVQGTQGGGGGGFGAKFDWLRPFKGAAVATAVAMGGA